MRPFSEDTVRNEELNKVYNAAIEEALRLLPGVTAQLIKTTVAIDTMTKDFLDKNPDFKGNEAVVTKVIMQTESENPGKTYDQVLSLSAPRIRATLKTAEVTQPSLNFDSIVGGNK